MKDIILELYNKYQNGGKVAKELGINNYQVYKCLRENGIQPKKVGGKEKHPVELMKQMYTSGLSTIDIGTKLCMSPISVRGRLVNHGVNMRSHSEASELSGHTKIKQADEQHVIDRFLSGESPNSIADYYDTYKDSVYRILRKHDIPTRPDMKGSNNPAWKGGITSLHNRIRNSDKYNDWRKEIFKERKYTCEISGVVGNQINVHHIVSFSNIFAEFLKINSGLDDNELFDLAMNYEPFWDKTNTIVISEEIHKKIHSAEFKKSRSERAEVIKKLAEFGWSKDKICSVLNMCWHTLQKILKENSDIKIVSVSERQSLDLDKSNIQSLVDLGCTDRQIAQKLGVAHTTIKRYRMQYKIFNIKIKFDKSGTYYNFRIFDNKTLIGEAEMTKSSPPVLKAFNIPRQFFCKELVDEFYTLLIEYTEILFECKYLLVEGNPYQISYNKDGNLYVVGYTIDGNVSLKRVIQ